ncbi:helix-turn-helix domain-containing protein [Shimwellia blattae]|nr:XRE family transcriptional regulator [Shimwellia blattae]VDY65650.1 HTH-type transcriptional regulator sinR [Shimwellia blattae]VEC25235.1 HTH-type transcriptional regulator sinR [Shimwellia blattae]
MTKKVNIMTGTGSDVERVNQAVAERIKTFRKNQKLSLDELSRRAGISKGMLVDIERCLANPSIAMLCKISAAMSVSVADIVDVAEQPSVHLIAPRDIPQLWEGESGGSARLLAGTSGPDMVELWRWEMHPGERYTSPAHPEGTCELLHVEQGTLILGREGQRHEVGCGSSAIMRADAPHYYANESGEKVVFTMAVSERHSR